MNLKVIQENDAIYFRIDDSKIIESKEVEKWVILDFNEQGNMVGIEIIWKSQHTSASLCLLWRFYRFYKILLLLIKPL